MSKPATTSLLDSLENPVCEICGCRIDEPDQDCPALSEGVCAP